MEFRSQRNSVFCSIPIVFFLGFILTANSSPAPLLHSMSSHPVSNQLTGENPSATQTQTQDAQIEMPHKKSPTSVGEFIYRHPANLNHELQTLQYKNPEAPRFSFPGFGLASLADFQLSTYLPTIFWCLTLPIIVIAVLVYLQRLYLPNGIMEKIRGARSLNLDWHLDELTDVVYQGLNSAGKWAQANLKEFSSSIDNHQKTH